MNDDRKPPKAICAAYGWDELIASDKGKTPMQEIADELGCAVKTVYATERNALMKLRANPDARRLWEGLE